MTREDILKLLNKHQDNDTLDIKTAKEMVNIIFDEHEVQLKAKYEEIERLKKLVNDFNNTYSVGDFDFESYYAMLKDN
ncbi:MAG: hypothetical protein EOM50_17540 [Erysipelotrichia bacterium]|nr:hypothetical protein [Erysipelotrichia bacterium]